MSELIVISLTILLVVTIITNAIVKCYEIKYKKEN